MSHVDTLDESGSASVDALDESRQTTPFARQSTPFNRQTLREELERYVSTGLRAELATACSQLREELVKDLQQKLHTFEGGKVVKWRAVTPESLYSGNHAPSFVEPSSIEHVAQQQPPPPPDLDLTPSSKSAPKTATQQGPAQGPGDFVHFALPPPSRVSLTRAATVRGALVKSTSSNSQMRSTMASVVTESPQGKKFTRVHTTQAWRDTRITNTGVTTMQSFDRHVRRFRRFGRMFERFQLTHFFERKEANLGKLRKMTWGNVLEYSISLFIFLNGIFIGVQTDYQARKVTEDVPLAFDVIETIFCIVFTGELVSKLLVHRLTLYYKPGWTWNVFDTTLVVMQLIEVIGMVTADPEQAENAKTSKFNFGFVRLLRILRLLRVLRIVRLLQFIDELSAIVNSIAHSFRSLCWASILLSGMIYMVGIVYAQIVFTHRLGLEEDSVELEKWWGSVGQSVLSLYQAILGGVDWENLTTPLMEEISPWMAVLFAMYIAFALLAVMNVITGTFVQSAVRDAEKDKIQDFTEAAIAALSSPHDEDEEDTVTYDKFEHTIENTGFAVWLENMKIQCEDAKLLFRIIDNGGVRNGQVDISRLVDGLVRVRDGAKYMDVMKLMYEGNQQRSKTEAWTRSVDRKIEKMTEISEKVWLEMAKMGKLEEHILINGGHRPKYTKPASKLVPIDDAKVLDTNLVEHPKNAWEFYEGEIVYEDAESV